MQQQSGRRRALNPALPSPPPQFKPTHVLNAAGLTGRPNVDWCESHKVREKERERGRGWFCCVDETKKKQPTTPLPHHQIETIRANVIGMLNLADVCHTADVHLTTYATGCIFHYDKDFPEGSGKGFTEGDTPNFTGSYYSYTKALVESLLKEYPNALILRVRMPIVGDLLYHRNFIAKILKYEKIINIPNSMTVLPELLPLSVEMARRGLTGVMNFTNPGAISHNEIMELYKSYVDPELKWSNFSVEEQAKVIVAPRSNNLLDTARIESEFPDLLPIRESLIKYVFEPAAADKASVAAAVREMRGR